MTWSLTMSLMSHGLLTSALLATLFNLILPATCLDKWPLSTPQAMLMEDKTRLGSMPPSCHNRCNACNPCTAVQVPTLPSRAVHPMDEQTAYSKYSNYKPLGWKCLCGNRLFNP